MTFGQQNNGLTHPLTHCGDVEPDRALEVCIYIEEQCGTFYLLFLNCLGLNLEESLHHKDI